MKKNDNTFNFFVWNKLVAKVCLSVSLVSLAACKPQELNDSPASATEQIVETLDASDPLVSISTLQLFQQLECSHNPNAPTLSPTERTRLIEAIKDRLKSTSEWERLQALQTLVACRADGLNVLVIEQFRQEKVPAVKHQIVEIIAMNANRPLQREIASRTLRSSDTKAKQLAYNLILDPYYRAQIETNDPTRTASVEERLVSDLDYSDPIIAAKNLVHLNNLGKSSHANKLIALVSNAGAKKNDRLNALATLALSGTEEAAPLFSKIIDRNGFDVMKRGQSDTEFGPQAVRYAKLGEIALRKRPVTQLKQLTNPRVETQPYEAVDVLNVNGSPEALDSLAERIGQESANLQHYIASSLFRGNDWQPKQLGLMLRRFPETDRVILLKYLKDKGNKLWTETFKEAMTTAPNENRKVLVQFLRHNMLTPSDVQKAATLKGTLTQIKQESQGQEELLDELRSTLGLFDLVEKKELPTDDAFKALDLDDQFQVALLGAQLKLFTPDQLRMLQKSDNSYIRIIGSLYDPAAAH